jgi:hypothetical protein
MAEPVEFDGANVTLYPAGGTVADVVPLHVRQADGALVSCWALTPAECAEILRTGLVWLAVQGVGMQPPALVSGCKRHVIGEVA